MRLLGIQDEEVRKLMDATKDRGWGVELGVDVGWQALRGKWKSYVFK